MTTDGVVLVTGATGFIGRVLSERLLELGTGVVGLVRPGRESALHAGVQPVVLPDGQEQLRQRVRATGATRCVHLAAHFRAEHGAADVADLVHGNVALTAAVADACAQAGVRRLVFTGTVWQHHGSPDYMPMSLYAATKQGACDVLRYFSRNDELAVDVVKLADTYGRGDTRRKVVDVLLDAAAKGTPLGMSPGGQLLDLVHVRDVVEALVLLLGRQEPGWAEWSLGSGAPLTLRELASKVAGVTGRELAVEWGARPYRRNEAFQPWQAGPHPPGWSPKVDLTKGLTELWESRVGA